MTLALLEERAQNDKRTRDEKTVEQLIASLRNYAEEARKQEMPRNYWKTLSQRADELERALIRRR